MRNDKIELAKGLTFRIDAQAELRAAVSKSSGEFTVGLEILALLAKIQKGAARPELLKQARKELELALQMLPKADALEGLIEDMAGAGVLVASQKGARLGDGFGDPWIQWAMVADKVRTHAYLSALKHTVNSQSVVLDLGAGTGIFSAYALALGAKRVIAVEETAAADSLPKLVAQMGSDVRKRFTLQKCNSMDADIPRDVNLIVSELFGNDPLAEGVLKTLVDMGERFPKAQYMPQNISIYAELVDVKQGHIFERLAAFVAPRGQVGVWNEQNFYDQFMNLVKTNSDFSELSFCEPLRERDVERVGVPMLVAEIPLNPARMAYPKQKKFPITVKQDVHVPALLVWYRVLLTSGFAISSWTKEQDACSHWSPIVIPFSRSLKKGEVAQVQILGDAVKVTCEVFVKDTKVAARL